jgi:hypothetical protein
VKVRVEYQNCTLISMLYEVTNRVHKRTIRLCEAKADLLGLLRDARGIKCGAGYGFDYLAKKIQDTHTYI